ncbi:MAG: glycine--tRNA ligase [Planctomycetes bacterium]|jgi:glycyl-tRNA synthetase|nr:glycine--tRNA ligase [Planctomycetota bacterium]MBT4029483.1 glycine--tRNA ligase [Planctomycetota bacterium]MBT4560647.1 glycine--tRNA ligase [Planctomycetota bacterium]MBT7013186.1 glycine--tRNA ligase [Planctomycetota bacterium]
MAKPAPSVMDKIVSLCKRRGFVFPASEIYGGQGSTYDWGPLGVELKKRVKDAWWGALVYDRQDVVGLDSAIIQSPEVWRTSGHVGGFSDPLIDNKTSKQRYRADHLVETKIAKYEKKGKTQKAEALLAKLNVAVGDNDVLRQLILDEGIKCPVSGTDDWTDVRQFNLMFETHVGAMKDSASVAYLRPETAQGIFINFNNVVESSRKKLPFGIAQIGKSFRNEITPGNFVFRTREFEQMEMEFFCHPAEAQTWYEFWQKERFQWYLKYGVDVEKLRMREHAADELAHYADACSDVEYLFPFGWSELEGVANRTDYDLTKHSEASGKKLAWFDQEAGEWVTPYVIEPAAGCDRTAMTFLVDAYDEEGEGKNQRVVLRFHPQIAPITVAVFPLVKKEGMPEKAEEVEQMLRPMFRTQIEYNQSIGRRYRRQDEIGTPFCITVDGETATDASVTVRERDTMDQQRVAIVDLASFLQDKMSTWQRFTPVEPEPES